MNSRYASIMPLGREPCVQRWRSETFHESARSQSQDDDHSNRADSSQKISKSNSRHSQWDESMPEMTNSGQRVRRADERRDFQRDQHVQRSHRQGDIKMTDVSSKGQHAQWHQRQRDVKVTDISHGGQHVQLPHTQRDFKMTDVSHRGQYAQLPHTQRDFRTRDLSNSQGKGQPFQRDARMPFYDQGRAQNVQHDVRTPFYDQGRAQNVQRDARTPSCYQGRGQHVQQNIQLTFHSQTRRHHAQQDVIMVSHAQSSAQHVPQDNTTTDTMNSNATDSKDPPGPVEKIHCKPLLAQIYADIHAASLPGAIQATADLVQLILLEGKYFSMQTWFQCNAALQTRSIFKVIEYAFAGQELCNSSRLAADVYAAANSVRLQLDHGLGRVQSVAKAEIRLASRHANLALNHGFMMLSILATSAAYREAARTLDDAMWDSFGACIGTNFSSLEYFAKIRGLDWLTALKRMPQFQQMQPYIKQRFPDLQADHPHTYIVPTHNEPLRRPTYKGQDQVPIQSNQYSAGSFGRHERPQGWASTQSYPSDPTVIPEARCNLCEKHKCACDPHNCDAIVKPLVEITNYGEKGNGIRVLQPVKKGDILEEYIGEIKHTRDMDDSVYSFSLDLEGNTSSAYIDAQRLGNWTRFINHSCEASAKFELKVIGQRIRVMIVANKDVDMFDELTIDYGSFFWFRHKTLCKCGSPYCVSKNVAGPMDLCRDPSPDLKNASRTGGNWKDQYPSRPYCDFYRRPE